ncbi:MAG: methyltransferase domain-containing protein [Bdellovibrionales bacterium]|nr:methyltransferase domain-containing protein [Bdellovibrionales bacterium]
MKNADAQSPDLASLLAIANKDRIYTVRDSDAFAFGDEVAEVFDDMVSRSVPNYLDLQLLVSGVAVKFHRQDTAIYDLGCSTGTSLALIAKRLPKHFKLYGVDSSSSMLKKAEEKLTQLNVRGQICLKNERLQDIELRPSSSIFANYTLQFLPTVDRKLALRKIYSALIPGGAFLLSEKTASPHSEDSTDIIRELHEDFKFQNGYSTSEIARKRESLNGVLVPLSIEENIQLLREAGFTTIIEVLRGYRFITWLCVRDS